MLNNKIELLDSKYLGKGIKVNQFIDDSVGTNYPTTKYYPIEKIKCTRIDWNEEYIIRYIDIKDGYCYGSYKNGTTGICHYKDLRI